jgi:hypothetical protein
VPPSILHPFRGQSMLPGGGAPARREHPLQYLRCTPERGHTAAHPPRTRAGVTPPRTPPAWPCTGRRDGTYPHVLRWCATAGAKDRSGQKLRLIALGHGRSFLRCRQRVPPPPTSPVGVLPKPYLLLPCLPCSGMGRLPRVLPCRLWGRKWQGTRGRRRVCRVYAHTAGLGKSQHGGPSHQWLAIRERGS